MFRNLQTKLMAWRARHPHRARAALMAAPIFALVLIIGIGFALGDDQSNGSPTQKPKTAQEKYADLLKPASTLQVGDQRYVSPCQVLTPKLVDEATDGFDDDTYVQENTYDTSRGFNEQSQSLTCNYFGLNDFAYAESTRLDVVYNATKTSFAAPVAVEIIYNPRFDVLKNAANTPESRELIKKIEASVKTVKDVTYRYQDIQNSDDLVLYDDLSGELWFPVGSTEYRLTFGNKLRTTSQANLADLSENLDTAASLLKEVQKNARNTSLSQTPINTLLGNRDKIGSTTILEPCRLLSADMAVKITGAQADQSIVTRQTLPYRPFVNEEETKLEDYDLPTSECLRNYTTRYEQAQGVGRASSTNKKVMLELSFAPSSVFADNWVKANYPDDPTLQTDAEWAAAIPVNNNPGRFNYRFRVGPYLANAYILNQESNPIRDTYGNTEEHIKLINDIVAAIKQ